MTAGSVEIHTPRTLVLISGHLKFFSGESFSFLPFIDPIHRASVFLSLSLSPEDLPKLLIVSRAADKESWLPLRIRVVSSAYWLNFISVLFTLIPLMLVLALIAFPRTSTESMKRYGDKGQPCRTPLCNLKNLLDHPLFKTQLSMLL